MNIMDLTQKEVDLLVETVAYYGDPETYFAIGFLADPPCGDFINDFEDVNMNSPKPGKKARATLRKITKTQHERNTKTL